MLSFLMINLFSLVSVINPVGTVPLFLGLTSEHTRKEVTGIALRAALLSVIMLSTSFIIGKYILQFFGISLIALKLTGGIIISMSGFALLSGQFSKHKGMSKRVKDDAFTKEDPSLTPLAMPMLAGPGSISFLISLNKECQTISCYVSIFLAILISGLIIFVILNYSRFIHKALGASGMNSLSRIIGFIIIALGIQYLLDGVKSFALTII